MLPLLTVIIGHPRLILVVRILRAQGLRRRTADKETVNVPVSAVEVTAEVRLQGALLFVPLQGKIRSSGMPPEGKKLRGRRAAAPAGSFFLIINNFPIR